MKTPCEIVFWHVLPLIRRELARELVNNHKLSQADVARKFGVTDSAISQYLNRKRTTNTDVGSSTHYNEFKAEVALAAHRIMGGSDVVDETCRLCKMVRKSGMIMDLSPEITRASVLSCSCPECRV